MPSINHIAYNAASEEIILGATLGAHYPPYETKLHAPPGYRAAMHAAHVRALSSAFIRMQRPGSSSNDRLEYDTRRMVVVA